MTAREAAEQPAVRVALVGHCFADSVYLKTVVQRAIPGAVVDRVNDDAALDAATGAGAADLLLVNRVLDGRFKNASGLDVVRLVVDHGGGRGGGRPRAMLISNRDEALQEAEAAGASPGFGKANAYSEEATARLRAAALAATSNQESKPDGA